MIDVKHLSHSYGNDDVLAVKDISFHVEKGETFGFLGPSGAGKSTTQGILTGLLDLQKGEVNIDGEDLRKSSSQRFNSIGVSFEQANVYNKLSALENLKFYASLFDVPTKDPMELLKLVGLDGHEKEKAGTFSKGMKHRLTFARSMINNPKLWFLDEPTTGLDPAIAATIKDIINEEKAKGTTVFLTTHNMFIADELCDRVAFIVDGEIKLIDTPKNLKQQFGKKIVEVEYVENNGILQKSFRFDNEAERRNLSEIIRNKNIITMHSKEATLEEIFIQVTGKELK